MSIRTLESGICAEARRILNNRTLRVKDLREWANTEIEPQDGEIVIDVPLYGVKVAVFRSMDKRKPQEAAHVGDNQ